MEHRTDARSEASPPWGDGLLWIGESYRSVAQFLEEAGERGCCRKVSGWPAWIRPAKSRMFLAHPGGRSGDRAVLFGYFTVAGVDIVLTEADCERYRTLHHDTQPSAGDARAFWRTPGGRAQVEPVLEFWRTRTRKGALPVRVPERDETLKDEVVDFLMDLLVDCGGDIVSTSQTACEARRWCGLRPTEEDRVAFDLHAGDDDVPAFYLVDALTRKVDEWFCELLKELLPEGLEQCPGDRAPATAPRRSGHRDLDLLLAGVRRRDDAGLERVRGQFRTAVGRAASEVRAEAPPDPAWSSSRGAMVVFHEPYPFFQRRGRTRSFRSLVRVDGDLLLQRIAEAYRHESKDRLVAIPYHRGGRAHGAGGPATKEQIVVDMACELQVTKALAGRVLDWVAQRIASELSSAGSVRLNRIGTFKVDVLRGARLVDFRPSQALTRVAETP
ncbi:MAG: HU family DNA-binding protein [Longimicrobiaceae bacterium]